MVLHLLNEITAGREATTHSADPIMGITYQKRIGEPRSRDDYCTRRRDSALGEKLALTSSSHLHGSSRGAFSSSGPSFPPLPHLSAHGFSKPDLSLSRSLALSPSGRLRDIRLSYLTKAMGAWPTGTSPAYVNAFDCSVGDGTPLIAFLVPSNQGFDSPEWGWGRRSLGMFCAPIYCLLLFLLGTCVSPRETSVEMGLAGTRSSS